MDARLKRGLSAVVAIAAYAAAGWLGGPLGQHMREVAAVILGGVALRRPGDVPRVGEL